MLLHYSHVQMLLFVIILYIRQAGQTSSHKANTRPRTFLNPWHSTALNYISDKTEINNVHAWTPAHTCKGKERLRNAATWKPSCYVTTLRRCSGEYRRHTDSEVAQFLTFVSMSADMYSSFGGSTAQLDCEVSNDVRSSQSSDQDRRFGNCTYQLH